MNATFKPIKLCRLHPIPSRSYTQLSNKTDTHKSIPIAFTVRYESAWHYSIYSLRNSKHETDCLAHPLIIVYCATHRSPYLNDHRVLCQLLTDSRTQLTAVAEGGTHPVYRTKRGQSSLIIIIHINRCNIYAHGNCVLYSGEGISRERKLPSSLMYVWFLLYTPDVRYLQDFVK